MPSHRPYPSYHQTGLPWLGHIPAHWEVKRLKFVAPASTNKLADKPDDLPYVGLENIESGTGRLLMETQPETVESNVGIFEKGDMSPLQILGSAGSLRNFSHFDGDFLRFHG